MHNIGMRTYPLNVNKDEVKKELDGFVAHEDWREGCTRLWNDIRWLDVTLESYDKAEAYINAHDRGNYDNLAVKFRCTDDSVKNTSKYKTLAEREKRLIKEYYDMNSALYLRTVKSAYVTCRKCGSKIASKVWGSNKCPVCGQDFRSDTMLERISAKRKAYEKASKERAEYCEKYSQKNGKVEWLVKFEYHT